MISAYSIVLWLLETLIPGWHWVAASEMFVGAEVARAGEKHFALYSSSSLRGCSPQLQICVGLRDHLLDFLHSYILFQCHWEQGYLHHGGDFIECTEYNFLRAQRGKHSPWAIVYSHFTDMISIIDYSPHLALFWMLGWFQSTCSKYRGTYSLQVWHQSISIFIINHLNVLHLFFYFHKLFYFILSMSF